MAAANKTKRTSTTGKKTSGSKSEIPVKTTGKQAASAGRSAAPVTLGDLERVFDGLLQRVWRNPFRFDWPRITELGGLMPQTPAVDVVDRAKEVVVRAHLPGIKKSDLDVSIADRVLTIKGSTRTEEKEEKDNFFRQEIRTGSFSKAVQLPADVDAAKAQATFKDGVLELQLPKRRVAKQQQVPVR
jgi:HSP20 family protein